MNIRIPGHVLYISSLISVLFPHSFVFSPFKLILIPYVRNSLTVRNWVFDYLFLIFMDLSLIGCFWPFLGNLGNFSFLLSLVILRLLSFGPFFGNSAPPLPFLSIFLQFAWCLIMMFNNILLIFYLGGGGLYLFWNSFNPSPLGSFFSI